MASDLNLVGDLRKWADIVHGECDALIGILDQAAGEIERLRALVGVLSQGDHSEPKQNG